MFYCVNFYVIVFYSRSVWISGAVRFSLVGTSPLDDLESSGREKEKKEEDVEGKILLLLARYMSNVVLERKLTHQ